MLPETAKRSERSLVAHAVQRLISHKLSAALKTQPTAVASLSRNRPRNVAQLIWSSISHGICIGCVRVMQCWMHQPSDVEMIPGTGCRVMLYPDYCLSSLMCQKNTNYSEPMRCLEGSLLWQEILGVGICFVQKHVCVKKYEPVVWKILSHGARCRSSGKAESPTWDKDTKRYA